MEAIAPIPYSFLFTADNTPMFFGKISSSFGTRKHPVSGKIKKHKGIDIPKPKMTPIYAPADGIVIFSGWRRGYGNVIEIDHQNGYTTLMAHNHKNLVTVGEVVFRYTMIGYVGATGVATGPHMHVEVRLNSELINPIKFIF